ncbi:MAG: Crp/Fnr family transcriptional regulator [Firmicutes bacterium]|nr:Crp/Fnr family transcriptional regulator [Bacillota bacterium]
MDISKHLSIWPKLTKREQERLVEAATFDTVKAGEHIHDGNKECTGLILVASGQLRAYIISESGKEITLYRLLEGDICLFSASCIINNLKLDIMIKAEKDTSFWLIPTETYKSLMDQSVTISNYTNEILASRMSDIVYLMEQVMWHSFDQRLASFLVNESTLENSERLSITHEEIANHMGTAREVVTRMLKYFQSEGLVSLSRGSIEINDVSRLKALAE